MPALPNESLLVLPLFIAGGLPLLVLIYGPLVLQRALPRWLAWSGAASSTLLIGWSVGEASGLNCHLGL